MVTLPSNMKPICAAAILLVLLTACGTPTRAPDIIGVVVDVTDLPGPLRRFAVEGGEFIDVDLDRADLLADSRGAQNPGTLLLAGEDAGAQWYMSLEGDGDCFLMDSYGSDAGDAIDFDNGLRLPKAEDFDPGIVTDGRYDKNPQGHFCVNDIGEVVSYDG